MPSGGITITPGYQLAPGEKINNAKLNQLGQPVGQVDEGAITDRELSSDIKDEISHVTDLSALIPAKNLLCNGNFINWSTGDYINLPYTGVGVSGSGRTHDYKGGVVSGSNVFCADQWVIPNDPNRSFARGNFLGAHPVPDNPLHYLHIGQSAPLSGINPAYVGQRLESSFAAGSVEPGGTYGINGTHPFDGGTYTFSIWARSDIAVTVIPSCRLYFGSTGSAQIVLTGTPVNLALAGPFVNIKQTFTIPSLSGKVVSGTPPYNYAFTEFRLELPQGTAFNIDVAHASLTVGDKITAWDQRLPHEDLLFAWRYLQILGFNLVNAAQFATFAPFANLRTTMLKPDGYRNMSLRPVTGTGATIGVASLFPDAIYQSNAHSVQSTAYIVIEGQLHAPT